MSSEFVRYRDDIEVIDPDIEKLLPQVIDFWVKKGRASPKTEGHGHALRGAHAKSFGFVRAEVDFLPDVPAPYAQGIYAKPGRHDVLMRFSSSNGHMGPDAVLGPGQGLAIKIFDIEGLKLVDDEPQSDTFDLVLKNSPIFIANTARHYLFMQEIIDAGPKYFARGKPGFHDMLSDLLTGRGTLERPDWAWDEVFAFVRVALQTPVTNPALTTFWTMAAVRHGDYIAKVRVAPTAEGAEQALHPEINLEDGPDVYRSTLVHELQARAFDWELQVQLCTDLEKMPVNDVTVEWPEKLSPFVTVGRLRVPRQDISGPENFERGDVLAFNQWRVTAPHRPLGEIMDVRRVYSKSAKVRRTLNHQPQTEPASADAVLR